jgi:hypothetical protein
MNSICVKLSNAFKFLLRLKIKIKKFYQLTKDNLLVLTKYLIKNK